MSLVGGNTPGDISLPEVLWELLALSPAGPTRSYGNCIAEPSIAATDEAIIRGGNRA